jgi:hypothetical protein
MNLNVETGKQGKSNCIEEKKLRFYKFNLNMSSHWLLLAPYIGGQVLEFRLGAIQTQRLCQITL